MYILIYDIVHMHVKIQFPRDPIQIESKKPEELKSKDQVFLLVCRCLKNI